MYVAQQKPLQKLEENCALPYLTNAAKKSIFYMNVCDISNLTVKGHSTAVTCNLGIVHILVRLC